VGLGCDQRAAAAQSLGGWAAASSMPAMANGGRECGGERGVVTREVHYERGRTVIGYGQRKRPGFWGVTKRLIGELAGAGNGNAEVPGE